MSQQCFFHRDNPIIKFCTSEQCTLPLCSECETIHLQEHRRNATSHAFIPISQAYASATALLSDRIARLQRIAASRSQLLQTQRLALSQTVQLWFSQQHSLLNQSFQFINSLTTHLHKLNSKHIKTLIHFYSQDIPTAQPEFILPQITSIIKTCLHKIHLFPLKPSLSSNVIQKQNLSILQLKNGKQVPQNLQQNSVRNITKTEANGNNIFKESKLQQHKQQNQVRLKAWDKENILNIKCVDGLNKKLDSIDQKKQKQLKYSYDNECARYKIFQQNNQVCHKKDFQINKNIINNFEAKQEKFLQQINVNTQGKNSAMEQLYLKGTQQYKEYLREKEKKIINTQKFSPEIYSNKENTYQIRKSSHINYQPEEIISRNQNTNFQRSNRNRTYSQTTLNRYSNNIDQQRKHFDQQQLRKHIMSPQEIRKMLEKRIEERNKILCLKNDPSHFKLHQQNYFKREEELQTFVKPQKNKHEEEKEKLYTIVDNNYQKDCQNNKWKNNSNFNKAEQIAYKEKKKKYFDVKDSIINEIYPQRRY